MNAYNHQTTPLNAQDILAQCTLMQPQDDALMRHPVIGRYGSPGQSIYIEESTVELDHVAYQQPLILPIYDADLNLIQCAALQCDKPVKTYPERLAKGFAKFGQLDMHAPVIVTYNLEAFFKIAQTGYAVVLVILANLCRQAKPNFTAFDFEQIQFVIQQLHKAGFSQLYLPVRPEYINMDAFLQLEQKTGVKLMNQFQEDIECDLSQDDDAEYVASFLDEVIEKLNQPKEWGKLIPLSQDEMHFNPYPIHALPPIAQDAAQAIAEHVQAPIGMAAQCVIGAMSHIAQAKVNAPHPFSKHGEPSSLFLLTEGQSGSRKSTSRSLADMAIIQYERKQYEIYRAELEQWKTLQAGLAKKDREAFAAENPPPQDPSTLFSDITLESIAGLYIDGILQNASIASDEAGQFFCGHTMKADTRNQALGGYAKLFDDGCIERTRSKSNLNGSGRAHDVRLTFNLQGQREILAEALKDPVLRGQGFLPRFILTVPENLAGTRLQDAAYRHKKAHTDPRLIAYWKRCETLLDDCPHANAEHELHNGRYVLPMDDEAETIDRTFYNLFESLQGKGQRFEYLQAFASRASQLARRLATVFAYFEGLACIDGKTLNGACEVIQHSLNEWAMYADIETKAETEAERLARYLIHKCTVEQTSKIAKTVALKGAPAKLRKAKDFDHYLNELIQHNYLRLVRINKTQFIELNPVLLK